MVIFFWLLKGQRPTSWILASVLAFCLSAGYWLGPAWAAPARTGSRDLREKGRQLADRFSKETKAQVDLREHGVVAYADRREPRRGDEQLFYIDKKDRGEKQQIPAILRLIGTHCYVFVEKGQTVSDAKVAEVAKAFDESVYETNHAWFGSEWTPGIDGDPRITLLLVDGMTGCDGYFDPEDEYTREKCPTSNEREMVVLAISRLGDMKEFIGDLLAHEFQHMIHWNHDPKETTWVDEACSGYAATLYRHFPFTVEFFLKSPHRCLIDWDDTVDSSNYGHVFLFFNYLIRNCSNSEEGRRKLVKAIVASKKTSISGVEEALSLAEVPLSMAETFRMFCAACYLGTRQNETAGRLGFDPFVHEGLASLKVHSLKPVKTYPAPKAKIKGKGKMWSALAFRFKLPANPGPIGLSFAGQSFEAKKGRNFFDIGLLFQDPKGKLPPHLSWIALKDNCGEQTLTIPAGGYPELLVVVCNRGPGKLPANEKQWPAVPFLLEIGPAGDAVTRNRFEQLHRQP